MPDDWLAEHKRNEVARRAAAMVDGKHYSAHAPEVRRLMKAREFDAAAGLLVRLVEAVEREAAIPLAGHIGMVSWYHEHLADAYKASGMERERALTMQRYASRAAAAETAGHLATQRMRRATAPRPREPAKRRIVVDPASRRIGRDILRLLGALLRALTSSRRK